MQVWACAALVCALHDVMIFRTYTDTSLSSCGDTENSNSVDYFWHQWLAELETKTSLCWSHLWQVWAYYCKIDCKITKARVFFYNEVEIRLDACESDQKQIRNISFSILLQETDNPVRKTMFSFNYLLALKNKDIKQSKYSACMTIIQQQPSIFKTRTSLDRNWHPTVPVGTLASLPVSCDSQDSHAYLFVHQSSVC